MSFSNLRPKAGYVVAALLLLAGCGDPGLASPSVGISVGSDSYRLLLAPCPSFDLKEVHLSRSKDMWAKPEWTLTPDKPPTGSFEIDLGDLEGWTLKGDKPFAVNFPLAVQLVDRDGGYDVSLLAQRPTGDLVRTTGQSRLQDSTMLLTEDEFVARASASCGG